MHLDVADEGIRPLCRPSYVPLCKLHSLRNIGELPIVNEELIE